MGALLEPLSVAIHAFKRAQQNSKSRPKVLIFGAGTIGLCCAAVCRFNEATITTITDIQSDRVTFAQTNGFASDTFEFPAQENGSQDDAMSFPKEIAKMACERHEFTTNGYDVVFECTGAEICSQAAIFVRVPTAMFS